MNRLLWRAGAAALLVGVALSSGCATVTGSENQMISLATYDPAGEPVVGAECKLTNNNGTWTTKTPASVSVRKSAEDLMVRCETAEHPPGTTRVVSRVNGAMFGNILIGGIVGAAIDHTKGTAYDYPTSVRVVFGANRTVEADEPTSTLAVPTAGASPPAPRPDGKATLDDLDGLLKPK